MTSGRRCDIYRVEYARRPARRRDVLAGFVLASLTFAVLTGVAGSRIERMPVPEPETVYAGPVGAGTREALARAVLHGHAALERGAALRRASEIRSGAPLVALTFDDGPWPGTTQQVLDVLDAEQVPATFFMLGVQAKRYPKLARAVASSGNQVGNHTYGHSYLPAASGAAAWTDIQLGAKEIWKATGHPPVWFRPPYGQVDTKAVSVAEQLDQRVVNWTVDSLDWRKPGTGAIVRNVLDHVRPGGIVLLHDGGGDRAQTVAALPPIIHELKKRGYVLVTVDELVAVSSAKR